MSSGGIAVACGTRPGVGLIEAIPQQCAGLRSEPPTSLPSPSGLIPDASADASPPLEPPAVTFGSHGLRVSPRSEESVWMRRPEVRQVRAADRDRARGAQALDLRRVDGGDGLGERRDPGRRGRAGDVDVLLDRERDAVQRAAAPVRRVGRVGGRARLVGQHDDDRVQVAVHRLDALQVRVDDLARGHLAARDQLGQFTGATAPKLLGQRALLLLALSRDRTPPE